MSTPDNAFLRPMLMNTSNTTKLIRFDYLCDVLPALSRPITFLSCLGEVYVVMTRGCIIMQQRNGPMVMLLYYQTFKSLRELP